MVFPNPLSHMERRKTLLTLRFPSAGVLIWPVIRYRVLSSVMEAHFGLEEPHAPQSSFRRTFGRFYLWLIARNAVSAPQADILMVTTSRACIPAEGKFFNTLADYFAGLYPDKTVILEKSFRQEFRFPRSFERTYCYESVTVLMEKFTRVPAISEGEAEQVLKDLRNALLSEFGHILGKEPIDDVVDYVRRLSPKFPSLLAAWKLVLRWINPKVVFVNCASYGGEYAFIVKAAHDLGIRVAEFQHGSITKLHPAYNYGPATYKSREYRDYLPDFLLTYGEFWNSQMKTPSRKVVVGNPHFWESVRKLKAKKQQKSASERKVLFISQGSVTKRLVRVALSLSNSLKRSNFKIIYRLHPGEVPFKDRYSCLFSLKNVEVNWEGDIYDLIAEADYIVGAYSTALFEAYGAGKPVFVLDIPITRATVPEGIGTRFRDAEELSRLLHGREAVTGRVDVRSLWDDRWAENYRRFLRRIGVI